MVAIWSSLLASLVVRASCQGTIADPTSVAGSQQGSGYAAAGGTAQLPAGSATVSGTPVAHSAVSSAMDAISEVAHVAGVATTGTNSPQVTGTFNPNDLGTAKTGTGRDSDIAKAVNALAAGDQAGVEAAKAAAIAEAPDASGKLVEGFIMGYFDHVTLQQGEKECIASNMQTIVTDTTSVATQIAQIIGSLIAHTTPNYGMMMAGAGEVVEIGTGINALMKKCARADMAAVMEQTWAHLRNPEYVKKRMLANGLKMTKCMADTIPASEAGNFYQVGFDFGSMIREALLSQNTGAQTMKLINGMTPAEVGPACVEGVFEGMFVLGTEVKVRSSIDPNVAINVDLHRCIAKEAPYFATAMNALYVAGVEMLTQLEKMKLALSHGIQTGVGTGQVDIAHNHAPVGQETGGGLGAGAGFSVSPQANAAFAQLSGEMGNLPVLMDRCGLNPQQTDDFQKAFQEIKDLKFAFTIPGPSNKEKAAVEASTRYEQAERYWEAGEYRLFGVMTGGLLRDLMLTLFPSSESHSVQHVAAMSGTGAPGRLYSDYDNWEAAHSDVENNGFSGSLAVYVAGFAAFAVVGLAIIRVRSQATPREEADFEAGLE